MIGSIVTQEQSHEKLRDISEFPAPFEIWGPAVWREGAERLSMETVKDYAQLGRFRGSDSEWAIGQAWDGFFGVDPSLSPTSELIDPDQANAQFGFDEFGNKILNFKEPVSLNEAQWLHREKIDELNRLKTISKIKGWMPTIAEFSLDALNELTDPLGLAAIFFPILKGTRTFGKGFLETSLATAGILTPGVIKGRELQSEWGVAEGLLAVAAGGTLGGTFAAGIGKFRAFKAGKMETEAWSEYEQRIQWAKNELNVPQEEASPEMLRIALAEFNETGNVTLPETLSNIQSLKTGHEAKIYLSKQLKEAQTLLHTIREQPETVERNEQIQNMVSNLEELQKAVKDTDIKMEQFHKEAAKEHAPKKVAKEEPKVKVTRVGEQVSKAGPRNKYKTSAEYFTARQAQFDAENTIIEKIQQHFDPNELSPLFPGDQISHKIVRNSLAKLFRGNTHQGMDDLAFWAKTAPYEDIHEVLSIFHAKKEVTHSGRWNADVIPKTGWDFKEPIDLIKSKDPRFKGTGEDWESEILRDSFRNWQAHVTKKQLMDIVADYRFGKYGSKHVRASKTNTWTQLKESAEQKAKVSDEDFSGLEKRFELWSKDMSKTSTENFQTQLELVKKTLRQNIDKKHELEQDEIDIPSDPEETIDWSDSENAAFAADEQTHTILMESIGSAEYEPPKRGPLAFVKQQVARKELDMDEETLKGMSERDKIVYQREMSKLRDIEKVITQRDEALNKNSDSVEKNVENSGNCINGEDDVPF